MALEERERELVALGAAIAANCVPCVEYHVPKARQAGLSEREIEEALRYADKLRKVPARLVLEAAMARVGQTHVEECPLPSPECGCG